MECRYTCRYLTISDLKQIEKCLVIIFNWPSKVKGKLHWLFCSATVVGAEMLAERELSGPADHWMALANEGKRLRPFNLRDYAALYLYWNRYKVCKLKDFNNYYISAKKMMEIWFSNIFLMFNNIYYAYIELIFLKIILWEVEQHVLRNILLCRYYLLCRLRNSMCYK